MKIAIIGTSCYYTSKMIPYKKKLKDAGHEVQLPILDDYPYLPPKRIELMLMAGNLEAIKWADAVHVFWDGRSMGAWGDICMSFAVGRPIKVVYLEKLSCRQFLLQYAKESEPPSEDKSDRSFPVGAGNQRVFGKSSTSDPK